MKNNCYICNMRIFRPRPLKDILVAFLFMCVMCLLIFSAVWAYRQYRHTGPYVDPDRYPVRGIDISRHNGEIDFDKVKKDGIEFAFIKASEGVSHQDSNYESNIASANKAGLKTGAYHFFRFDAEGVDQAQNFLNTVGRTNPELGLVIDVEDTGNPDNIPTEDIQKRLVSMVEYMNLLGHRVMIYTNLDGYYQYIHEILPGCLLWICRFQENPINAEWTFWQYDHHGKVDGVKGEVDLNAFCGTREEWQSFLDGDIWPYTANNKINKDRKR